MAELLPSVHATAAGVELPDYEPYPLVMRRPPVWASRPEVWLRAIELLDGPPPTNERVFEATRREARRVGHRCPEPEHLLLALYAVRQGVACEILTGFGATEERAREALGELLDREAPELAERVRRPPRRRLSRR